MGILIVPRMIALGAIQIQLLALDYFATGLGSATVAINNFARNFESVIPGIIGISLAQASFSLMSQSAAAKNFTLFRTYIIRCSFYSLALSLPAACVLAASTGIAAWLMHLSGSSMTTFKYALIIYAIAVPFDSINHLFLRSFYSLKNTFSPALCSTINTAVAITAAVVLLPKYGSFSLAIAFVVSQCTQSILLGGALAMDVRKKMITIAS
jgi:peptidoglycan biosynthesis protein MviN/MurJ (putative lipid II flippase)